MTRIFCDRCGNEIARTPCRIFIPKTSGSGGSVAAENEHFEICEPCRVAIMEFAKRKIGRASC